MIMVRNFKPKVVKEVIHSCDFNENVGHLEIQNTSNNVCHYSFRFLGLNKETRRLNSLNNKGTCSGVSFLITWSRF